MYSKSKVCAPPSKSLKSDPQVNEIHNFLTTKQDNLTVDERRFKEKYLKRVAGLNQKEKKEMNDEFDRLFLVKNIQYEA